MGLYSFPKPGRVHIPGGVSRPFHMPTGMDRVQMKVKIRLKFRGHRMKSFMLRWKRNFLKRSGAALRTWIIKGFKRRKNKSIHSPVETPPYAHLKKSEFLNKAILYAVDLNAGQAVVGVSYQNAQLWGKMHEQGGLFREKHPAEEGQRTITFPRRPFVKPVAARWMNANRHIKSGAANILKESREWAYKN